MDGAYRGDSDRPTGENIHTIGNYAGGGQRFAEYLDDFRVYGVALTDFEVETALPGSGGCTIWMLARGVTRSPCMGQAYSQNLSLLLSTNLHLGWYEGGGGEYMQAKLGQGTTVRITIRFQVA